jgi:UDPglucose 6-dehydrogenase
MRIAMIGTGYVGLVSGTCLAELGHDVTCVDSDLRKIEELTSGRVPIYEPGLEDLVRANVAAGRLRFVTDLAVAVQGAEAVFIAVGTPARHGDGHTDLSHVLKAATAIGAALARPAVVVVKSTVPVGTAHRVAEALRAANPGVSCEVASNPEFLREGSAIADFLQPDRVVVGVDSPRAAKVMEALYRPFLARGVPVMITGTESAEMVKYAANAFLATKITFINEIAALCERLGADVREVARGMGLDRRIGARFLDPGPGFGGSCLPKDTRALVRMGQEKGAPVRIVEAVVAANDAAKRRMVRKIAAMVDGRLAGARVAVLGVTFKAGTDDMREAPALTIIPALQAEGAEVTVTDPKGQVEAGPLLLGVHWAPDAYAAATGADVLVLMTEWEEFRHLDLPRLAKAMAVPRLADLRNVLEREAVLAAGFLGYVGVGR